MHILTYRARSIGRLLCLAWWYGIWRKGESTIVIFLKSSWKTYLLQLPSYWHWIVVKPILNDLFWDHHHTWTCLSRPLDDLPRVYVHRCCPVPVPASKRTLFVQHHRSGHVLCPPAFSDSSSRRPCDLGDCQFFGVGDFSVHCNNDNDEGQRFQENLNLSIEHWNPGCNSKGSVARFLLTILRITGGPLIHQSLRNLVINGGDTSSVEKEMCEISGFPDLKIP